MTGPQQPEHPVLAVVERGGFAESVHRGSAVVLGPDGGTRLALGDPGAPVLPRSSLKPLQAVGLLRLLATTDRAGALAGPALALACGSHDGEAEHVAQARATLAAGGLTPAGLRCPPGLPFLEDAAAQAAYLRSGGAPERLRHNCSGKHAAMLLTAAALGADPATYLDAAHPVQAGVRDAVADLAGGVSATVVDGCGAPQHATTLLGLARAFGALVTAAPGTPERAVADAARAHPRLVAGQRRLTTRVLRRVPGLLLKEGAEGVWAGALADGTCFAAKVDDGAQRALAPVLALLLRAAGLDEQVVASAVPDPAVLGGGRPVGSLRPAHLG